MAKVELKQVKINEIKEKIQGAASIILVDARGLTVEQDTVLRKNLREANVTYKVYKNTMMTFAFKGTEFEKLEKYLAGPSAIAISYDDATAAARVLSKMTKDFKNLQFKGGVVEGVLYDEAGVVKVASIPSREELLSKLLGSLKSPISTFARLMKATADKATEVGAKTAGDLATGGATEEVKTVAADAVAEEVTETVTEAAAEAAAETTEE